MAGHTILKYNRHHRIHAPSRHASHGAVLPSSALVHCVIDRRKHGPVDDGVDG
jgi:hypothetical protein